MEAKNLAMKDEKDVLKLESLLEELGRKTHLRDPIANAMESMGLTPQQLHTVMWLSREKKLTMGTLAQRLCVTEKSVTGLVDRLERIDLVRRVRDDVDRRVVHVCLSEEGVEVAGRLQRNFRERMTAFLSLLDARDRTDMFRIIGVLLAHVSSYEQKLPSESE